jgi:hypothetical protein
LEHSPLNPVVNAWAASKSGGGELKKASEYRQHAEECRMLARNAASPEHKAMLENMAATWESLAVERERRLSQPDRIAAIENAPPEQE